MDREKFLFVHEDNFKTKINVNYGGLQKELKDFYEQKYLPMRDAMLALDFSTESDKIFQRASKIINDYYSDLDRLIDGRISSQSKLRSTFLEELSVYMFMDQALVADGTFGIYNKGIYAGMKIGRDIEVNVIKKDVDFCIGKQIELEIEGKKLTIILPVVAVEVKTYLDATMFGEVQYSGKLLKNATPKVRTYVLMERNEVSDDKIIAARYENILDEMFVLRGDTDAPVDAEVLKAYYKQVSNDLEDISIEREVKTPGRLLHPDN